MIPAIILSVISLVIFKYVAITALLGIILYALYSIFRLVDFLSHGGEHSKQASDKVYSRFFLTFVFVVIWIVLFWVINLIRNSLGLDIYQW